MAEDRVLSSSSFDGLESLDATVRAWTLRGFRLLESKRGSTSFARMRPACCVFVSSCRVVVVVSSSSSRVDRQNASCGFVLVRLEMLESSSNEQTQLGFPQSL